MKIEEDKTIVTYFCRCESWGRNKVRTFENKALKKILDLQEVKSVGNYTTRSLVISTPLILLGRLNIEGHDMQVL
jgi:hypothetical protein